MKRSKLYSLVMLATMLVFLGVVSQAYAGTLYFSEDLNSSGLYTLDTTSGAATLVGISGVATENVGLSPSGSLDILFGSHPFGLLEINIDGSGATQTGSLGIEGLAYDPSSSTLYGAINTNFFTVNPVTGTVSANLASPLADVEGLAFGNGGIYGLVGLGSGGTQGDLFFYNIGLDSWSFIGNTGVAFDQVGLAFDSELGILYGKGDQDSLLYSIDPATAALSTIGDTGIAEGGGLAFLPVPEPATLFLIGTGLVGLVGLRRKFRS